MVIRLGRSGDDAPEALHKAFERCKHNYGSAQLRFALVTDRGKKILYASRIDFLPKDVNVTPAIYDYGTITLMNQIVSIDKGYELIQKIAKKEPIRIMDDEFLLEGNFDTPDLVPSKKNWGGVNLDWPHTHSSFRMNREGNVEAYHDPLVRTGLPAYPNLQTAVQSFLDLRPKQYSVEPRIIMVAPDYRLRISEVRLSENKVTVEIDSKEPDILKNVICKFYLANDDREHNSEDISVKDYSASSTFSFQPSIVNSYFITNDGDRLDFREINIYSTETEDLVFETPPLAVEELIRRGESQTVEFKEIISDNTLAETVVAFANTSGGMIIVGVDNNSKVVGFKHELNKIRDTVTNIIGSSCEPPPHVDVESISLEGNIPILLIRVPQGKDPPYMLRDRGTFVRRNATNRQATRHEMDDFYKRDEQISTRYTL